ncbi:MAG: class I SAM-dependent methyltransferase [Proteobacteria bacterium]|nr:class I SAM-dependent methyltransferase [Pseudomonadota bacterium]
MLDYGAGKAEGYQNAVVKTADGRTVKGLAPFWGIDNIAYFDPGYEPFAALPEGQFDGVISTDVLEHCPEEDIDWILREIFAYSRRFVFCTVAVYLANKKLPTGENAHVTVKSPGWWLDKFNAARDEFPLIRYHLAVMHTRERMTYIEG